MSNKQKRHLRHFLFTATTYFALTTLWDVLLDDEVGWLNNGITGIFFGALMTFFFRITNPEKELIAFVPQKELKQGMDWRDLEVVKQHLQQQYPKFQKAAVTHSPDGLEFRITKAWGLRQHVLKVVAVEEGLQLSAHTEDSLVYDDGTAARMSLLSARRLLAGLGD